MKMITKQERDVMTRVLREPGSRGGRAAAAAMTPHQRHARAQKAAKARAAVRTERKAAAHV